MDSITQITLDNGVRILLDPNDHVHSAAVGLWCSTGSSDEFTNEAGITHFIEHMLFKGTPSRSAREIAESIEGRGGILNAFTDKEQTCYHCRVLADDVENGLEVLSDMMLNSLLDQEEIDRECKVIQEEIKRGEDEPSDQVHDLHIQARWSGHALGKPIIGTRDSVASFRRDDFVTYMKRRYCGENVVLGIAGMMDVDRIISKTTELFAKIPAGAGDTQLPAIKPVVTHQEITKDTEQVHFCIGTDSFKVTDETVYTVALIDNILGSGMSSRLFQEVRERRGLAYSIGSYSLSYSAGGLFTIYGGTGIQYWDEVKTVVRTELDKIMQELVSPAELERTKRTMAGNISLALEGMNSRMIRIVRNELNHGRFIPIEETLEKINAVTAMDIQNVAQLMFSAEKMSLTALGPFGK